jgi:PAS domain S-box-containing protein
VPLSTPRSFRVMQRARRARQHPFFGYIIAMAAVAIATLVRWQLGSIGMQGIPFTTYYLAILFAAFAGGLRSGLLATVLSAALAWIMFIPPELSFEIAPGKTVALLMFLLTATLIVMVVVAMNRAFDWVHDQERNIRTLIEASPNGMLLVDEAGRITAVNKATEELFGYDRSELLGRPVEILVPPRQATEHVSERLRFMRQPAVHAMGKGRDLCGHRKDGSEFPIEVGLTPLHQEGRAGTLATVIDISERKAAQDRQLFLVKELEHRSQNLFAVIRSIAARSLSPGQTVAEAKDAFEARLLALSRAHKMVGEAAWKGAPLAEIIKSELSAFEKNLSISGCDLFVNMTAAQQFALIMHELATNAAKYGALSSPTGKVAIKGKLERVDGEQVFAIAWTETGGPPVRKPRRKGFGSTILVDGAKKFGQAANLHFDQGGLRYELRIPLNSIAAVQATPARHNV